MAHLNPTLLEFWSVWGVIAVAIAALIYAAFLAWRTFQADTGTSRMQQLAKAIDDGANVYLNRQLRTMLGLIGIPAVALFLSVYLARLAPAAQEMGLDNLTVALGRAGAFLIGSAFSILVGRWGMNVAVKSNVRVASAAHRSFDEALKIAYRSATVTGMLTDGLGLLGGALIFIIFGQAAPEVWLGFAFGGTFVALFMRVGGGIYTKAADLGAGLVSKVVKQHIPEDDPRNAAVVADLVGDNVGDCAGMAVDIFTSYELTIVSAMILGLAIQPFELKWLVLPLLVRAIGVISSIVGTCVVPWWPTKGDGFKAMDLSYNLSSFIAIVGFLLLAIFYAGDMRVFAITAAGILLAVGFKKYTGYFTHPGSSAVQDIARSCRTGSATNILTGIAIGYESTVWSILIIALAIMTAILVYTVTFPVTVGYAILGLGATAVGVALVVGFLVWWRSKRIYWGGLSALGVMVVALIVCSFKAAPPPAGNQAIMILYAVAMIGIGMLSQTGNNVSMDAFGSIADNAGGIGEMVGVDPKTRQVMVDLNAVGNTTKAITKGIAIASAVIAAVSLFGSFIITSASQVAVELGMPPITLVNIADPRVFIGLLIGGALSLLFSSLLIYAVGRTAGLIVQEVRRQFRIPGILEGIKLPDYARAVAICTEASQKEVISLALLVVLTPIAMGLLFQLEALGGFLAGIILMSQLLAVFMANAGGAWHNARKIIEDGLYGGKGSEPHKASVVGDTVGDSLKDTAGPALNSMVKAANLVSLLIVPLIVAQRGQVNPLVIGLALASVVVIIGAIWYSKKEAFGGVSEEEKA